MKSAAGKSFREKAIKSTLLQSRDDGCFEFFNVSFEDDNIQIIHPVRHLFVSHIPDHGPSEQKVLHIKRVQYFQHLIMNKLGKVRILLISCVRVSGSRSKNSSFFGIKQRADLLIKRRINHFQRPLKRQNADRSPTRLPSDVQLPTGVIYLQ